LVKSCPKKKHPVNYLILSKESNSVRPGLEV
jgi:hypothetical protein